MTVRVLLLVALTAIGACSNAPRSRAELFVPPDAEQLKVSNQYNGSVEYRVLRTYPPDAFLVQLNEHMAAHGFHPANPDIFGQQNSHSRGWGDFIDGTHTPNTHVAMWMGDWRAANGDCITTALRYVTPVGKDTDSTAVLEVTSMYMNARTVAQMQEAAKARKQ